MKTISLPPHRASRLPWFAGGFLVFLLAALAVLQARWLHTVAAAERQRLDAAVETALAGVAAEVDREVSRAWLVFARPLPRGRATPEDLAALWDRWQETAPAPELIEDLLLVDPQGGRRTLRLVGGRWVAAAHTPPAVAPRGPERAGDREAGEAGEADEDGKRRHHGPHWSHWERRGWVLPVFRADLPGFQVPLALAEEEGGGGVEGARHAAMLLVVFDREFMAREQLPALLRRYLGPVLGDGVEALVTERRSGEVVHASEPGLGGRFEWETPILGLLPPEDLRRLAFATGAFSGIGFPGAAPPGSAGGRIAARGNGVSRRSHHLAALAAAGAASLPAAWTLAVRPAEGSLDTALARAHRGNAALSFGILLLLGLAALSLAVTARRAQETARRQLEFTAAVSHELRTPLAAIRSLADNLADGVVRDPAQARLYGEQIARQGERLTEMVEQVLALSAHEAGLRARRAVDLPALVREAVAEAAAAAGGAPGSPGANPGDVEVDLPEPGRLPPLEGDPEVLRRAVQNLVANALKHGGVPPHARVRVAAAPEEKAVRVEVSDDGPGVPAAERDRIFEPFFRGARAQEAQLPGVGLGLHLVRRAAAAHGGRVEVRSRPGGGSIFALVLPAAAAATSS